jgi:hypothetical protein
MPDDGMLILIDVPPQPEELKPFLVHGAIVDGRAEGAFVSIVRRRGRHDGIRGDIDLGPGVGGSVEMTCD